MNNLAPGMMLVFALLIALAPIALGLLTSYIKVSVVLGMLRSGLGAQQVPGNMVIMALSLAMTCYIMSPVISESIQHVKELDFFKLQNLNPAEIEKTKAIFNPWKTFLEKQSGQNELIALQKIRASQNKSVDEHANLDSGWGILIPAFLLSELKEGFSMAFMLLLPFLVIDLIVANILAGMGMYMVSPSMISLPIKLILFVSVDGWLLLTRGVILSYQ